VLNLSRAHTPEHVERTTSCITRNSHHHNPQHKSQHAAITTDLFAHNQPPQHVDDKRHLLRLWLSPEDARPVPEQFLDLWGGLEVRWGLQLLCVLKGKGLQ